MLQTLGVFRQVQGIDGPEPMPPPSALIAVTQGLDEGWHCLRLPGCSSIAQGQILVLPKRKLTVRRHTRLQIEEREVDTLVSPISPYNTGPFRNLLPCRKLLFCHLKKMALRMLLRNFDLLLQTAL